MDLVVISDVGGRANEFSPCDRGRSHTPSEVLSMAFISRGDLLDQRSRLMEAWAEFCEREVGEVRWSRSGSR